MVSIFHTIYLSIFQLCITYTILRSAGCVFAGLLFLKDSFFFNSIISSFSGTRMHNTLEQLTSIASILGSDNMLKWAKQTRIDLSTSQLKAIGNYTGYGFRYFINNRNKYLSDDDGAIDLLTKMLEIDPRKRYSTTQCLEHSYFQVVK